MTTIIHDERGVAAVEAALVLPLMLAVGFGSVDLGLSVVDRISLGSAAACGARYAAQNPDGDVAAFTTDRCIPPLISTTPTVTVENDGAVITVTVTGIRRAFSPFLPGETTLVATAVMPVGGAS